MGYQALYRKYRPSTFDDFIDQDNVKKILVNSIKNNKISHAYLFYGPRGIGKTSMAKIFAKAINCLDFNDNLDVCDKCENWYHTKCLEISPETVKKIGENVWFCPKCEKSDAESKKDSEEAN